MSQIQVTKTRSKLEAAQVTLSASEELARLMPDWGCPKLIPLDEKFQKPEQVDYFVERVGKLVAAHPEAAAYQPGAIL